MTKGTSKQAKLARYLAESKPAVVDRAEMARIAAELAPVSDRYLRELLRASGTLLAPLVEGVRQTDFDELDRTLRALQHEYQAAARAGDREIMRLCRQRVIEAKDHARWAARRAEPDRKRDKEEMAGWMLVWLENPAVFPAWVTLRRRALTESRSSRPE